MRVLAFLSNISLSLALVANRSSLSPRLGVPTPIQTTVKFAPPLSLSSHTLTRNVSPDTRIRKGTALPATAAASAAPSLSAGNKRTLLATSILILLDTQFRSLFQKYSIPFPSSLAGCGALFASMILLNAINDKWGEGMYEVLNPGATLLAKWLPVFFVPSLITLPLASGLGNAWEVLKLFSVIIGGFFFTLFTTAWSVLGIRKVMGDGGVNKSLSDAKEPSDIMASNTPVTNAPPKAFSKTLFRTLKAFAWITGASTVALVKNAPTSQWINPLQSSFLLFMTLSSFVFGANLPKSFTKAVHPLVTCTSLTWIAAKLLASLTGTTYLGILSTYKAGTLAPLLAGAGDLLLFLLGPAVVALACQMYGRKKLMRENIPEVGVSTLVSSLGGLYGTAAAVRLLGIGNPTIRLSLLSRNITSPLAMAIASILGADVSLAVTIVVLTGLFGANFGASILDAVGIKDAVARGLGMGAAAHGLGTAAFANEKDSFPFAAIAMALTASACTVLVSVPVVKKSVLKLALGAQF
ncbi:hypothetical protein ACHAXR_010837 [Thalassiosira sp. AJA248-18]